MIRATRFGLITLFAAASFAAVLPDGLAFAPQTQPTVEQRVASELNTLEDSDWKVREAAFYRLVGLAMPAGFRTDSMRPALDEFLKNHPSQRDGIATGIIGLLEKEGAISRNAAIGSLSEEFENYLGDLVAAAATLQDDRAVSALLPELRTGNMASKAVAASGSRSVDRVLALLNSGDIADRIAATRTLSLMLDPAVTTLDPTSRTRAKTGILLAVKDPHFAVRDSAVAALARLPDPDVTMVLKDVAANDPYSRLDGTTGATMFPVRAAAAKALAAR